MNETNSTAFVIHSSCNRWHSFILQPNLLSLYYYETHPNHPGEAYTFLYRRTRLRMRILPPLNYYFVAWSIKRPHGKARQIEADSIESI